MTFLYDLFIYINPAQINEQRPGKIHPFSFADYLTNAFTLHPGILPRTFTPTSGVNLNIEQIKLAYFITSFSSLLLQAAPV